MPGRRWIVTTNRIARSSAWKRRRAPDADYSRMLRQDQLPMERYSVYKINKVEYPLPQNIVTVHRSNRMIGSCPDGSSAGTSSTPSRSRMRSRSAIWPRSHSTWRCSRMTRTARSTATRSPRRPLKLIMRAPIRIFAPLTSRTAARPQTTPFAVSAAGPRRGARRGRSVSADGGMTASHVGQ